MRMVTGVQYFVAIVSGMVVGAGGTFFGKRRNLVCVFFSLLPWDWTSVYRLSSLVVGGVYSVDRFSFVEMADAMARRVGEVAPFGLLMLSEGLEKVVMVDDRRVII
jgi:hypothetical protein